MNIDVATTRILRMVLIGGTIILALAFAADVFKPVALAVLLTFLVAPLATRLERLGLHRVAAVAVVVLASLGAIGATSYVVGNQFASLAKDVPKYLENVRGKVDRLQPTDESTVNRVFDALKRFSEPGDAERVSEDEKAQPVRLVRENNLWEQGHSILGPFESLLATGGIVLLLVIFLLIERDDIGNKIIQLSGRSQVGVTTKTLAQMGVGLSKYLSALALVNAGFGLVIGLGSWAIGLPSPALWGFLAGMFRFIPYLGTVLSFAFPFLIAIGAHPGWTQPMLVLGLFAGAELAVNAVEPILYGKSTGISPIGLLVSAMFWAWLWGPLGLLLANALTVCLAVAGRSIPGLEALGTLLSHEVVVGADLRFYQRALSHDTDGAAALLDEALQTQSFEEVCDRIIIPTLARAEQDRSHDHVEGRDVAFIWRLVRDWLDDVAERDDVTLIAPQPAPAKGAKGAAEADRAWTLPAGPESRTIVGLATGGGADALVLRMLNMLLKPSGVRLSILSAGGSSLRVTDKIVEIDPALILISHLPPVGLTRARYLTKRMRARHPEVPMAFGYWDSRADTTSVIDRLRPATVKRVVVTLAAARAMLLDGSPAATASAQLAPAGSASGGSKA